MLSVFVAGNQSHLLLLCMLFRALRWPYVVFVLPPMGHRTTLSTFVCIVECFEPKLNLSWQETVSFLTPPRGETGGYLLSQNLSI